MISATFYVDSTDESDKYSPTTAFPDLGDGDNMCMGHLEYIRFTVRLDALNNPITIVKLLYWEKAHFTKEILLLQPLYMAYEANSMIRIESKLCRQAENEFKGFTIVTKGKPPPIFTIGGLRQHLYNSKEFYDENLKLNGE